jgi:hypothetical protein
VVIDPINSVKFLEYQEFTVRCPVVSNGASYGERKEVFFQEIFELK